MNQENLAKLWKWLSLGCFAYVPGSVISIQGGVNVFGAKPFADLEKDGPEVLVYFAVIVGAWLSCLALAVAILYARRHALTFVTLRRGSRIQSGCSRPSAMIVFSASVRDRPRWRQNHSPVCRCH
jgi:hypothetical protein